MFFAPKSADVRIWRPLLLARKMSALDNLLPPDCERLLWTAPKEKSSAYFKCKKDFKVHCKNIKLKESPSIIRLKNCHDLLVPGRGDWSSSVSGRAFKYFRNASNCLGSFMHLRKQATLRIKSLNTLHARLYVHYNQIKINIKKAYRSNGTSGDMFFWRKGYGLQIPIRSNLPHVAKVRHRCNLDV